MFQKTRIRFPFLYSFSLSSLLHNTDSSDSSFMKKIDIYYFSWPFYPSSRLERTQKFPCMMHMCKNLQFSDVVYSHWPRFFPLKGTNKAGREPVKGGNPAQSLIEQAGTIDLGPFSLIGRGGKDSLQLAPPSFKGKSPKDKLCKHLTYLI